MRLAVCRFGVLGSTLEPAMRHSFQAAGQLKCKQRVWGESGLRNINRSRLQQGRRNTFVTATADFAAFHAWHGWSSILAPRGVPLRAPDALCVYAHLERPIR